MEEILIREFNSLEEAFAALPQRDQEHANRVSEYMRVLFLEACSAELYPSNAKTQSRLQEDYRDLAMLIGKYHDIGKAYVPSAYHNLAEDFSPEEIALYQKHAADSAKLLETHMPKLEGLNAIAVRFAVEAVESHHERWNGAGFPKKQNGENISILARLLAVADAMDHLSAEKHSEKPLDYAIEQLQSRSRSVFDPKIVDLLKPAKAKLKRVFDANIAQTKAVPPTDTIIRRSSTRPMALWYRPIVNRKSGEACAYEAEIRFREKKTWWDYSAVEASLRRDKMLVDLGAYMLLEACDTLCRLDACHIPAAYIALEMPAGWLNRRGAYKEVLPALQDTGIAANRLCLIASTRSWAGTTKTMEENLKKLREIGVATMISHMPLSLLEEKRILDLNPTYYRVNQASFEKSEGEDVADRLAKLTEAGIILIADDSDKKRLYPWLNKAGVVFATGPSVGDYVEEDSLVERELALQDLQDA